MVENATGKIALGTIPPADNTTAYVWSNRTFGFPFGFDDISVVTADGNVPMSITRLNATSDSVVFGFSTENFAWLFVFLMIGLSGLLLFALNHSFNFVKRMLADEDYYLDERVRFEGNPEKYSVPDSLPKRVASV